MTVTQMQAALTLLQVVPEKLPRDHYEEFTMSAS